MFCLICCIVKSPPLWSRQMVISTFSWSREQGNCRCVWECVSVRLCTLDLIIMEKCERVRILLVFLCRIVYAGNCGFLWQPFQTLHTCPLIWFAECVCDIPFGMHGMQWSTKAHYEDHWVRGANICACVHFQWNLYGSVCTQTYYLVTKDISMQPVRV